MYEMEDWSAGSQLHAVAIVKDRWLRDALIVDECPIETVEIGDCVAAILLPADLGVTARDHSTCCLNGNIRNSIATE